MSEKKGTHTDLVQVEVAKPDWGASEERAKEIEFLLILSWLRRF